MKNPDDAIHQQGKHGLPFTKFQTDFILSSFLLSLARSLIIGRNCVAYCLRCQSVLSVRPVHNKGGGSGAQNPHPVPDLPHGGYPREHSHFVLLRAPAELLGRAFGHALYQHFKGFAHILALLCADSSPCKAIISFSRRIFTSSGTSSFRFLAAKVPGCSEYLNMNVIVELRLAHRVKGELLVGLRLSINPQKMSVEMPQSGMMRRMAAIRSRNHLRVYFPCSSTAARHCCPTALPDEMVAHIWITCYRLQYFIAHVFGMRGGESDSQLRKRSATSDSSCAKLTGAPSPSG